MKRLIGLFFLFSTLGCAHKPLEVSILQIHPTKAINSDLDWSRPIVDVNIHHVDRAGIGVGSQGNVGLTIENLILQFRKAKKVFRSVGIELHLKSLRTLKIPESFKKIVGTRPSTRPNQLLDNLDYYQDLEQKKYSVPKETLKVFNTIISPNKETSQSIHVINLTAVEYYYFEARVKNEKLPQHWNLKNVPTGGFSFPAYMLEDRIPQALRGVLTVQRDKVLAHEIGHKLINVSHEGLSKCPAFSGNKIPGLLGYHGKTQIYSGKQGRFHKERLLKSPYVYRLQNGQKVFNPDYKSFGIYADPIYGESIISPACS